MNPDEFLDKVWGYQNNKGYGLLSFKSKKGRWQDHAVSYPTLEEIELPNPDENDIYFCPSLFEVPYRRAGGWIKSRWLYADLDEVDPRNIPTELRPTVAWKSSNERYQALWLLRRKISRDKFFDINKRLSYHLGADRGGWDITQVLRLPGTRNHKYNDSPLVKLLWFDESNVYSLKQLDKILPQTDSTEVSGEMVAVEDMSLPDLTAREIFAKHRHVISKRARVLLRADRATTGERSDRLWELENLLLDAGLTPEEVFILVRESSWNKYRGRDDETKRLWTEIQKAVATMRQLEVGVGEGPRKTIDIAPTGWEHHDFFMQSELTPPDWMVEGIWSDRSHGIFAGEPKGYKSVLATELAIAVASGCDFLGKFKTKSQGPVLIIQEENAPWLMQSRLRKIEYARGLLGHVKVSGDVLALRRNHDVELEILNQAGFDLTDPLHLEALEKKVQAVRPALIILDPLYMMLGDADENSIKDMRPILQWLLQLKVRYGTGVLIVHHYAKQGQTPRFGGQRMLGSVAFHGWVESALYIEKPEPNNPNLITVHREHRNAEPQGSMDIEIFTGDPKDDTDYNVIVHTKKAHKDDLLELVIENPGISVQEAAKQLKTSQKTVRSRVKDLPITLKRGKRKGGSTGRPLTLMFHNDN